jgi:hypothetical protein
MGLKIRFHAPKYVAPMAFIIPDLLADYTDIGLIYQYDGDFPEDLSPVYNANSVAGKIYKPSIKTKITH